MNQYELTFTLKIEKAKVGSTVYVYTHNKAIEEMVVH